MYIQSIIYIFLFCKFYIEALKFENITPDVFANHSSSGLISAFGDFNSDKLTDLFIISRNGKSVQILLAQPPMFGERTPPSFGQNVLECNFTGERTVVSLVPTDFNGDSKMDLLVSFDGKENNISGGAILWGELNQINCDNYVILNMTTQPLIIDCNDDMLPDIMSEDDEGIRSIWLSFKNQTSHKIAFNDVPTKKLQKLRFPHSSSIVDLNNDLVSDLIVTGQTKIEIWIKQQGRLKFSHYIEYPTNVEVIGQSTFIDFNTNAELDHIIPVCYDKMCKKSSIMIHDNNSSTWQTLFEIDPKGTWGFLRYNYMPTSILEKASLPVTLRAGDFNMDGYPDFIIVVENKTQSGQTKGIILENIPCTDTNCNFKRTFQVHWNVPGLSEIENIKLATFYDIYNDGAMGILTVSMNNNSWQMNALGNTDTYDAYFIKVLVLSGICYSNCVSGKIPYGTNTPGPMVRYGTTKPNGESLVSCAVQMSQTAHFPLHLPYTVFGLGQTPNFVDHLTVAIPEMINGEVHKREWTQIIPNSQMVVIPHPPDNAHKWVNKLFLTPSRLVLLTFLALLGTCCFIGMVIMALHWKERLEDKKEKMQDAYRFHFDAM